MQLPVAEEKGRSRLRFRCYGVAGILSFLVIAPPVQGVEVAVAGIFGSRAALVVDGAAPQTIAIGKRTREGVILRKVVADEATLEYAGKVFTLRMGQHTASAEGTPASQISLVADSGGHFFTDARINGAPVRVVVDTGATFVSMGRSEAMRLGIDYQSGVVGQSATANGLVRVWKVKLDTVELRGLRLHGVDAAVHDSELPVVLLGMSFMNRMDWRREGDTLMLRKRY